MQPVTRVSVADFAAAEDASSTKHELVNGQVLAMSGASSRHNAIAANLMIALGAQLRGRGCRPYGSDQRVHVLATDLDTYPDLAVVCGPLQRSPSDRHAVVNPALLVEVLSPSTESYDRGAKWGHYQQIPSLREYLLVSGEPPRIERFFRGDDGVWRYESATEGGVRLAACAATLTFEDVFADLPDE